MSQTAIKGVEIEFDDNGNPMVEGKGFNISDGNACKKLSDALLKEMGATGVNTQLKPEFRDVDPKAKKKEITQVKEGQG